MVVKHHSLPTYHPPKMILIGGSGSTGSSLLRYILNRHPALFSGWETRLFIYPHLFKKWNRYKRHLISGGIFGIRSTGWSLRGSTELLHEDYGWQEQDLKTILSQSKSLQDFAQLFFEPCLKKNKARHWIEKTPQNACSFHEFLDNFPTGKVIQIHRNPYDVVASLLSRGIEIYDAVGYYVYYTSAASSLNGNDRYFQLGYKELVTRPEDILKALLEFIGVPFLREILEPSEAEINNPLKMKGWKYSQNSSIKSGSLGRFQKLNKEIQKEIIAYFNLFKISDLHQNKYNINYNNCRELCELLGYEYFETDTQPFLDNFLKNRRKDMLRRTLKLHPTHFLNYPGDYK